MSLTHQITYRIVMIMMASHDDVSVGLSQSHHFRVMIRLTSCNQCFGYLTSQHTAGSQHRRVAHTAA
ncbi:hypothetical protein PAXRUDRAFT_431502 [Paxillus rubicundulus Ve08.2h10]|uniref:Uncharacterized protein n=1 Tax=Paxillus rubicundulus Ve08.2h10 TaxID=930991 RepID=A0A0D0DFD6_9AGAM|nr:hypothetical protein PAXRUDRAFT_431502 [Paxillus rubicundulus Ve08.2h10]